MSGKPGPSASSKPEAIELTQSTRGSSASTLVRPDDQADDGCFSGDDLEFHERGMPSRPPRYSLHLNMFPQTAPMLWFIPSSRRPNTLPLDFKFRV
ncbi:unnamed protein product [Cuscuta europaea]|uniref:Uncharacterized protein n=1 Tax=Cuscuta europaea TaxID=41803 RepID=A0A9P0ZN51_CUSEU|nr:unnamed protein product [Cuscuta europaea]